MFHHMKIYTVHIKPGESHARQKPLFIKEGFNFFAFVLTFFWALYHRLWIPALLLFGFNIALVMMLKEHAFSPPGISAIDLCFHLFVGFEGNNWLRQGLKKRGFILADIASGDSLLAAEQRYFERILAVA